MKKPDYTALSTLQRCEQEYVWRHVRKLRSTGVSASAHFGQMVHVGVRALYDGKSIVEASVRVRQAWAASLAGVMVANALNKTGTWACAHCDTKWDGPREYHEPKTWPAGTYAEHKASADSGSVPYILPIVNDKKLHLSVRHAVRIVETYAAAYLGANHVAGGVPIVGTQQPYKCIWNEGYAESATESGLPDRAMEDADGNVYAMDLKTTGMYVSSQWQRSFEHSQQVAMQLDILEATLKRPVAGFILDAINVRASTTAVSPTNLVRYGPLSYSDALRAELREQRKRLAVRANELQGVPETALKAPGACVRYNDLCSYFELCHADPADREPLVQIALERGKLEEHVWDPQTREE